MAPLLLSIYALSAALGFPAQDQTFEERAVARVQQQPARKLDPRLGDLSLAAWLRQLAGPRAGINWQVGECGEPAGAGGDVPACVDITVSLSETSKFFIQVRAGGFKAGLSGEPRIRFIAFERKSRLFEIERLSDLPEILGGGAIKSRKVPAALPPAPAVARLRVALSSAHLAAGSAIRSPAALLAGIDEAPRPVARRVSEGVLLGNVLTRSMPVYPASARQLRVQGEVLVEILIDESGRVVEARAIEGPQLLRQAAEESARRWTFKPTILNGQAVRSQGRLRFVFSNP